MAKSKSSGKTYKIIIAILVLWSIASLITIVVWATSPDMKGASQCNEERKALEKKFKEEKAVWEEDRRALEEHVREGRMNQSMLLTQVNKLMDTVLMLNQSLDSHMQENAILRLNITLLENEIELHKATEVNLTAEIVQKKDMIEVLELNLTQSISEWESCMNLYKAAQSLQKAAEKQRDSCQTNQQIFKKQLEKCQKLTQSQNQGEKYSQPSTTDDGPPGLRSGVTTVMLLYISMLLISYNVSDRANCDMASADVTFDSITERS